jgi:hypothetical protein
MCSTYAVDPAVHACSVQATHILGNISECVCVCVCVCVRTTVNILFGSNRFPGRASYLCNDGCFASRKVVTNVQRRVQIGDKLSI